MENLWFCPCSKEKKQTNKITAKNLRISIIFYFFEVQSRLSFVFDKIVLVSGAGILLTCCLRDAESANCWFSFLLFMILTSNNCNSEYSFDLNMNVFKIHKFQDLTNIIMQYWSLILPLLWIIFKIEEDKKQFIFSFKS